MSRHIATGPAAPADGGPPRRRRKDDRPAEMIEAALRLFVEHGYAATTLADVARRAGVSTGLPYRYFTSKEELLKAAVRAAVVERLALGERFAAEYAGSTEDLLRRFVEGFWEFERTPAGGVLKLMVAEAANFPDLARFYMEEVVLRGRRLFAAILRRGVARGEFRPLDPDRMSRVVAAPLSMLSVWSHSMGRFDGELADGRAFLDDYLDLVLAGLRRSAPGLPAPDLPVPDLLSEDRCR